MVRDVGIGAGGGVVAGGNVKGWGLGLKSCGCWI